MELDSFDCVLNLRMFRNELKQIKRIEKYAKTEEGEKKFKSISHVIRSFIIQGIKHEMSQLSHSCTGRPKI